MEKRLKKEYREFLKKHSHDYEIHFGLDKPGFDVQRGFEGFVCYKAMTESRDPIIGLTGVYSKACTLSQLNEFFKINELNLHVRNVPPQIFVRVDSQDLIEKLSDKSFVEEIARPDRDFRVNDLYFSENIKNPNRNPIVDNYKKVKGLLEIIGDPCQVNIIPHNFPELDLSERISQLEDFFGKKVELVDYSYSLMLFDNRVSEVIKFYNVLEKTCSEYKTNPFFSTRDICWTKLGKSTIDLNKKIGSPIIYDHEPEISADYCPKRNFVKTQSIFDHLLVGEADFELVLKDDPSFRIRPKECIPFEIKPSEEIIQKIKDLGIKVLVKE